MPILTVNAIIDKVIGFVKIKVYDSLKNAITSTASGAKRGLDVNVSSITGGVTQDVNISAADGTPLTETGGSLDVREDNSTAILADTAAIDTQTATIAGDTTSLNTKQPALGAAATAASIPVNIASDQTVPVSAAALPLPAGAATEATLASLKDTDGIKKITDELPAGTQTIGNVKVTNGTDDLDVIPEAAAIAGIQNGIMVGGRADTNTYKPMGFIQPNIDGEANVNGFYQRVVSILTGFNGATWDRLRSVNVGQLVTTIKNSSGLEPTIATMNGVNVLSVNDVHEHDDNTHLDAENITTTTGFMLIDLSNASGNWPHSPGSELHVTDIDVNINPDTAFEGDIEIGFLTDVDATDGDFNILYTWHLDRKGSNFVDDIQANSALLKMTLDSWFGPTTANDTTFQTDVNLQGPDGTIAYPSGNGDLVMKMVVTAGACDVGIMTQYHAE